MLHCCGTNIHGLATPHWKAMAKKEKILQRMTIMYPNLKLRESLCAIRFNSMMTENLDAVIERILVSWAT